MQAFDSPTMRVIRELLDTPAMKAMQAFDSPTIRVIRELQDSLAKRGVQETTASLAIRTLQKEMLRYLTLSKQFNLPKF